MTTQAIKVTFADRELVSRDAAARLQRMVAPHMQAGTPIEFDFAGVEAANQEFTDTIFSPLVAHYGIADLADNVRVINACTPVFNAIARSIYGYEV